LPFLAPQINDWKQHLDHLGVANIIPIIVIPSPSTLQGKISILERSKEVAENGQKVADEAKAIADIFKTLLAKGTLEVKDLNMLEDYAGYGGAIAAAAQGVLDLWQGIKGEVTPQECENSLLKLGFVYGVGVLGDGLGGPVLGVALSSIAEGFLLEVDKLSLESYRLKDENSTPIGYENVHF
jgi:hypothetical protein